MRNARLPLVFVTIVLLVLGSASGCGRPAAEKPAGASKQVRIGFAQIVLNSFKRDDFLVLDLREEHP